jgi:hypothetical protein
LGFCIFCYFLLQLPGLSLYRYIFNILGEVMSNKLIKLEDGTLVEIEMIEGETEQISGGFANKVSSSFEKIKPVLLGVCRPIHEVWSELNKEMIVDQAEVQIGLSFESEGNLYVTRSKANANLLIKIVLRPNS